MCAIKKYLDYLLAVFIVSRLILKYNFVPHYMTSAIIMLIVDISGIG